MNKPMVSAMVRASRESIVPLLKFDIPNYRRRENPRRSNATELHEIRHEWIDENHSPIAAFSHESLRIGGLNIGCYP
jgi:hypothetical protein